MNKQPKNNAERFIGKLIDGRYTIIKCINSGNVGSVYYAKDASINDEKAVKFIKKEKADAIANWKDEITKVTQLSRVPGVVNFHKYGMVEIEQEEYVYIIWDYIPGKSLRQLIDGKELTMQLLISVIERSLSVFHACSELNIQHADFHSGNILVQNTDPLSFVPETREIWITDFGYGTFSNEIPPMDDYKGLARIIQQSLASMNIHLLEKEDRIKYTALKDEFPKYLLEENSVEENYARNPRALYEKLQELFAFEPSSSDHERNVGDYLAAELIGDRYDEWDALFVPKFLATDELLDRNICVLTGLRGCGKTMMFRRLSYDFQKKLGKSGIKGEESFVGFYLNARIIAEAFPWLPNNKEILARKQVINFFHLKWIIEILSWLKIEGAKYSQNSWSWLYNYFSAKYENRLFTSGSTTSIINSIIDCCSKELQESKLDDHYDDERKWSFSDYDVLENLFKMIQANCSFAKNKAFFLFLDDYSTPLVTATTQNIINPIIFRRNSVIYFKISTESTESFEKIGLNKKILEDGADYKLIELSILSLMQKDLEVEDIITSIFQKRINRSKYFKEYDLSLNDFLGQKTISNNERAKMIRENDKQTLYFGVKDFCSIWSSDIRELIKIFANMISKQGENSILEKQAKNFAEEYLPIISAEVQDNSFREAGGRFIDSLPTAANPSRKSSLKPTKKTYGEHLYDIVIAFQEIAYHDLKKKNSKNQNNNPLKQARKIELTSANGELSDEARNYYRGLIRYGVFVQDHRAKSVRGTVSTRLYVRSLLIPYCRITFSKRDSITLEWEDFSKLLTEPNEFKKVYKRRKKEKIKIETESNNQISLFD